MNMLALVLAIFAALAFLAAILQGIAAAKDIGRSPKGLAVIFICIVLTVIFGYTSYSASFHESDIPPPLPLPASSPVAGVSAQSPTAPPRLSVTPSPSGTWYLQSTGSCGWVVRLEVDHLKPGSPVHVSDLNFIETSCTAGPQPPRSWTKSAGVVGPDGVWTEGEIQGAYGSYHYKVMDDVGEVVYLNITYDRNGNPSSG
jgi:hypothetical protein